jgi:cyclic pyranopterin phosphate synthase
MYCRREGLHTFLPSSAILRYEEILQIVQAGVRLGISKVRITGGEPLVRREMGSFLKQLTKIPGINDVSITTNGMKLKEHLPQFKDIGIKRLNISLDSLNNKTFEIIAGHDGFNRVWDSIRTAVEMGFSPVKLNMVVIRGVNDHEIPDFANLTRTMPLHVRYIEYMPSTHLRLDKTKQILAPEIKNRAKQGETLLPVTENDTSSISERYRFAGGMGELGFISPVSKHFCRSCNRLRLTAEGMLRPCLLSDCSVNVRKELRNNATNDELAALFLKAAMLKPGYCLTEENENLSVPRLMSAIGG